MKLSVATIAIVLCALVSQISQAHRVTKMHKTTPAKPVAMVGDIWSDCSKDSDKAKIGHVSVVPAAPKKGDTLQVTANVTFDEKVTGGQLKVNLVVNKIPFISTNLDLCDIASMAGLSCPISTGQQVLKVSQQIPNEAPSGNYTGNQYLYDQNNNELACIALTLTL